MVLRSYCMNSRPWLVISRTLLLCLLLLGNQHHVTGGGDIEASHGGDDDGGDAEGALNNTPNVGLENSPLSSVVSVAGGAVLLPCDARPTNHADSVILVLIYKADSGEAIYSVDARSKTLYRAKHWSDKGFFESRARFQVMPGKQGLLLNPLEPSDAGLYRCRVDFRNSPSKNVMIKLRVIEPPRHILITSSLNNGRIVSGTIGPYLEGEKLILTCQVSGGSPSPNVVWWESEALLDDYIEENSTEVSRNSLSIPALTKADQLRTFQCTSSNTNMMTPLSVTVVINIAIPPRSLSITVREHMPAAGDTDPSYIDKTTPVFVDPRGEISVRVNRRYEIICESVGSRPKASLLWLINGAAMEQNSNIKENSIESIFVKDSSDENLDTLSRNSLQFQPTIEDDGKFFTCRAYNWVLNGSIVEDSIKVKVLYPPQVELRYISKMHQNSLEEGDSFSLDCVVRSSSRDYTVEWLLNGDRAGIKTIGTETLSGSRLDVQHASHHSSGVYSCRATNYEGPGVSQGVKITIKFAPYCSEGQNLKYRTAVGEQLTVSCSVDSLPLPVSFRWAFNRSTELVDMPQSSYSSSGSTSSLNYTPMTELDFGSVLCWAANDVGLMKQPCVIDIIPEGKPDPVSHCKIETLPMLPPTSIHISCTAGWDGGLNQTFSLEVRKTQNNTSGARALSSDTPVFNVKHLEIGVEYLLTITSINARSNSVPVTLTYKPVVHKISTFLDDGEMFIQETGIALAIAFGSIVVILISVLICIILTKSDLLQPTRKSPQQFANSNSSFYEQSASDEKEDVRSMSITGSTHLSIDSCTKPTLLNDYQKDVSYDPEVYHDSGCDTRNSSPCNFDPDVGPSYFVESGHYHNRGLSPPPSLYNHPVRQHLLPSPILHPSGDRSLSPCLVSSTNTTTTNSNRNYMDDVQSRALRLQLLDAKATVPNIRVPVPIYSEMPEQNLPLMASEAAPQNSTKIDTEIEVANSQVPNNGYRESCL